MDENIKKSWANLLNPEILRSNLIVASIYITAFELLKDCIISRIRDFFTSGFDQNGWLVDEEYKTKVLSKSRSQLYASLSWLKEMSVINDSDIDRFEKIKDWRNKLAHEMVSLLHTQIVLDMGDHFHHLVDLLNKIELWWIKEVEIPTNPYWDDREIDYDKITPGSIMTLRFMLDIALASKEESEFYFKEFMKRTN